MEKLLIVSQSQSISDKKKPALHFLRMHHALGIVMIDVLFIHLTILHSTAHCGCVWPEISYMDHQPERDNNLTHN